mmetsp:Transcript_10752/g.19856  ORF Transcript_10752/g.19856 Transcript_10752/m.19856 type:complete len:264 (+) Transcript_10752:756-1547(+)
MLDGNPTTPRSIPQFFFQTGYLFRHLSSRSTRSIFRPRSPSHRANTRRLPHIRKIRILHRLQTKLRNVRPRNASGLPINHINNPRGRLHRQSPRSNNAILQSACFHGRLLVILISKDLFHDRHHEHFEGKGCLVFGVARTNTGHNGYAFDVVFFHGGHDVVRAVGEHRVADIGGFSAECDDDSVDIVFEHFGHIRSIRYISANHSQVGVRKRLLGICSTGSLGGYDIRWISGQADDLVALFETLVDAFLCSEARCSEDGDGCV